MLAVFSAVFSGLLTFLQKVGSVRGYNSSLLNSYSNGFSALIGFVVAGFLEGYGGFSWSLLGFGFISGLIYIIGVNFRMDALRYIDATILLPLHKFVSPLIVVVIGVTFFEELLSTKEWWGIILGMFVPLMLISSSEKLRQRNLKKGLWLMLFSAVFAAVNVAINKESTDIFTSVLLFMFVTNASSALVGSVIYRFRKKDSSSLVPEVCHFDSKLISLAVLSGVFQVISFATLLLAFANNGPLAVVYTIHSLYILIPISLAIIFYKEHWNFRKVTAIVLSILALFLMK